VPMESSARDEGRLALRPRKQHGAAKTKMADYALLIRPTHCNYFLARAVCFLFVVQIVDVPLSVSCLQELSRFTCVRCGYLNAQTKAIRIWKPYNSVVQL
jgi:hypothetical protein